MFKQILPTADEERKVLPGDDILKDAALSIDNVFSLPAAPKKVFPWFVQLGKRRGGWYFTRFTEKFFVPSARAIRYIDPTWQTLKVGDRIPDYGKDGYFDCFLLEKNKVIGYTSTRGNVKMTWVLTFQSVEEGTKVHIRLRAMGFRLNNALFFRIGEFVDRTTISWLASGLKERLDKA